MKTRRLNRNYFPEPKFQARFLSFLIGGLVLQSILTGVLIFYFVRENYTLFVHYGALENDISQALYRELRFLVLGIIGVFCFFLVGNSLLGIVFSHRIAGPIYALKRTIHEILEGKDAELNFRNRDEFKELVDSFNEMVRRLRKGEISAKNRAASG